MFIIRNDNPCNTEHHAVPCRAVACDEMEMNRAQSLERSTPQSFKASVQRQGSRKLSNDSARATASARQAKGSRSLFRWTKEE